MSGDLKAQRITILVVGLLLMVFVLFGPDEGSRGWVPPSSFHTNPTGARALYLATEDLGLEVDRWMFPADSLDDEQSVVVSLAPSEPLDRLEVGDLLEWVEHGGFLVHAAGSFRNALLSELDLDTERGDENRLERLSAPDASREALALVAESEAEIDWDGEVFEKTELGEKLFTDPEGRANMILLPRGDGHVLVLAGIDGLTNEELSESETALVLLRAIALFAEDGIVVFDEFHHGFEEGRGIIVATLEWLAGTRQGWAVIALTVVGFLALLTRGLRQGRPIPPPPKARRSSLEHVAALADAYQTARAVARPARELARGLRLTLRCNELEPTLDQLRRADPRITPDVDRVLAALHGPVDLVQLVESIDRVREVAEVSSGRIPTARTPPIREGAVA